MPLPELIARELREVGLQGQHPSQGFARRLALAEFAVNGREQCERVRLPSCRRLSPGFGLYGLLESLYERVKGAWEERFERSYGCWRGPVDEAVASWRQRPRSSSATRCSLCSAEEGG